MAVKIGLAGYYFYQLTPDTFRGKQFFNGYRGKVFGIAPLLSYNFKIANIPLFANVRYYTESDSKNYLKATASSLPSRSHFPKPHVDHELSSKSFVFLLEVCRDSV